jgi:hypothetical protein
MEKLALGLATLVFAAVITLLWVQRDQPLTPLNEPAPIAADDPVDRPSESILSAIETLESESDAKCNSSANRFEDFIYGTPLADEGRWANVDLQKRWCNEFGGRRRKWRREQARQRYRRKGSANKSSSGSTGARRPMGRSKSDSPTTLL